MRSPPLFRPIFALASVVTVGALSAVACFDTQTIWLCLNPVTGKLDGTFYDKNHFVNGEADPCHCYDPCGPQKSCPIDVDAGEPGPGCDAGDTSDGG